MMLGNEQIRHLVNNIQLISDFDEQCLRHCSYRLRIGKLIKPGGSILFDSNIAEQVKLNLFQKGMRYLRDKTFPEDALQRRLGFDFVNYQYELKPNELVIFQTREQIKMPMNLSASYSALDSIAKEGLLLINASMVEPGYEGFLSGVLLNFSSYAFQIKPGLEIAKINFYEVKGDVTFERSLKLEKQNSTIDSLSKRIDSLQSEIRRQYEKPANTKP